jgi:hypothetical protein
MGIALSIFGQCSIYNVNVYPVLVHGTLIKKTKVEGLS